MQKYFFRLTYIHLWSHLLLSIPYVFFLKKTCMFFLQVKDYSTGFSKYLLVVLMNMQWKFQAIKIADIIFRYMAPLGIYQFMKQIKHSREHMHTHARKHKRLLYRFLPHFIHSTQFVIENCRWRKFDLSTNVSLNSFLYCPWHKLRSSAESPVTSTNL